MSRIQSEIYILRFVSAVSDEIEAEFFWKLRLTSQEVKIFVEELDKYRIWVEKYLSTGEAPDCSYQDPSIVAELVRDQQRRFKRSKREFNFGFELWSLIEEPEEKDREFVEFLRAEYEYGDTETEGGALLLDILISPYGDSGEASYGYRALPFTQQLVDTDRFLE